MPTITIIDSKRQNSEDHEFNSRVGESVILPNFSKKERFIMTITKGNLFIHSLKNFKYFMRYHKKQIILAILIICTLIFGCIGFSADIPDDWETNPGKTNESTFKMIDDIFGSGSVDEIVSAVQIKYDDSGTITVGKYTISSLGDSVKSINNVCKGLAFFFAIMTFMFSIVTMRDKDNMDDEFIRKLLMFIVALVFIFGAKNISLATANVGSQLATIVTEKGSLDGTDDGSAAIKSLKQTIYENTHVESYDHDGNGVAGCFDDFKTFCENIGASLSYRFDMVFPWLAMKGVNVVVMMTVWGRALEILALVTFSPFAFMEVPDPQNILQGPGWRFFKNLLALSISGAIIIFIVICTHAISLSMMTDLIASTDFNTTMDGMFDLVIIGFAQAGMVMKSQQIAKTVVGIA